MFENLAEFLNRGIVRGGQAVFSVDYFRAGNFEIDPGTPGLYAWYFFPTRADELSLKNYTKVLSAKKLKGTISGNFSERYETRMASDPGLDHCSDMTEIADVEKVLIASSLLFANPVYIGRSKDLQERLSQHHEALVDALRSKRRFDSGTLSEDEEDSKRESKYFAERIANYILDQLNGNDSFNDLNFAVMAIKINSERVTNDQIKQIELYLNRSIRPVFGRL